MADDKTGIGLLHLRLSKNPLIDSHYIRTMGYQQYDGGSTI
jgi:hypothetical protein